MSTAEIAIVLTGIGLILAITVNIVAVSVAWGRFSTMVQQAKDELHAAKQEVHEFRKEFMSMINKLFEKTDDHGNRLTAAETVLRMNGHDPQRYSERK